MATPDIVNRQKASSHPLKPGSFYTGIVTAVDASGRVTVKVQNLGASYGPVMPLGTTTLNKLKVNDTVSCTFSDEFFTDLVVFGSSRAKTDVFAAKTVVDTLLTTVTNLQSQITSLAARVTALENS
jgi:hypothetical protein